MTSGEGNWEMQKRSKEGDKQAKIKRLEKSIIKDLVNEERIRINIKEVKDMVKNVFLSRTQINQDTEEDDTG